MKISLYQIVMICGFFSLAHADKVKGQDILDKKISVILDGNLRDVLIEIERKADVKFLFKSELVPTSDPTSVKVYNERLADVLNQILSIRRIRYEVDGNQIILTKKPEISNVQGLILMTEKVLDNTAIVVKGQILDEIGQAIPGASVMEKGTTNGTTTDSGGNYALTIGDESSILVISFIGYATQEVTVGSQSEINVTLQQDITSLNEVLVVGYGTQKKADVISSISTVNASDLTMRSMPNFEAGLQGLAAGVNVQSQSGAPGAPVKILIRGANSLNLSTDPLYIIDGMPMSLSSGGVGSSNQSPMALINQNDIESIQILKDAAATSIYGSRASNGVVLVTTKSAKKGEGSIQLNYSTGLSSLTRTPEQVGYANTTDWLKIQDQAYMNTSDKRPFDVSDYYSKVPLSNPQLSFASPQLTRQQAENINTNWFEELFRTGTFQNLNLSAAQGSDHTSFYISGNYRKDNGVQKNNSLERFTIRTNVDFRPAKNLTISSKLTFGYTKNNQRESGITSIATYALPWLPVYEMDRPTHYYNAYAGSNPVAVRDPKYLLNQVQQYRGLGGVSFSYQLPFIKGLSVKSELSADILQSNKVVWQSSTIRLDVSNKFPQSAATEETVTFNSLNYNAYADFNRSFNEHSINITGGAEATRSFQYFRSMTGTALNGTYQQIGSPTNLTGIQGRKEYERYLLGYFGRANYKYKDRYLLGFSVRRDGSTAFTQANRWATFLAVSAGWILSEEKFMSFLNGTTFLKIRGSYGEVGNQFIPTGLNSSLYNNASSVNYGGQGIQGVNGTVPVNIAVNNLKWETTRSSDVGVDFGFMNNRINGSFAYYHRIVDDMLLKAGLPYSAGVSANESIQNGQGTYNQLSSIWGNFGSMVNSGYELELHSVNVDKSGFKWTTDFNIGLNKSIIKKLSSDIDNSGRGLPNGYNNTISRKGDRRGAWYIADYAGVDPITGVAMIYARDQQAYLETGSTQRLKNSGGEDVLLPATNVNVQNNPFYQEGKSGDPKYQGGITNTVMYKGFDFSFMVNFSGGNYILDYDYQQSTLVYPTHAILKDVYGNSWKVPGDRAKYPELIANNTNFSGALAYHSGFLYKGDFIRLRNVQLGYNVSAAVLQRLRVKAARIYIMGSNLYTRTKYPGFDPETAAVGLPPTGDGTPPSPGFVYYSSAIPQLKTFTLGVDIKF